MCFHEYFAKLFSFYSLSLKYINRCPTNIYMKNPVYWRHRISGPMRIVASVLFFRLASPKRPIAFFCTCPFLFVPPSGFLEIYIFFYFKHNLLFFGWLGAHWKVWDIRYIEEYFTNICNTTCFFILISGT